MATSTSGDSVKLGSGMNSVAENTETWQRGLDPGMRWMKAKIVDGRANCALQCHMFYVF